MRVYGGNFKHSISVDLIINLILIYFCILCLLFNLTPRHRRKSTSLKSSNLYFCLVRCCLCLVSLGECFRPFVSRLTPGRTLNKCIAPQVALLVSMATNCCCFLHIPVLKCLHHFMIKNTCSTIQMQFLLNMLLLHLKTARCQ